MDNYEVASFAWSGCSRRGPLKRPDDRRAGIQPSTTNVVGPVAVMGYGERIKQAIERNMPKIPSVRRQFSP